MVEVLMGLAILGIGALGVLAMQKATLLGTTSARQIAAAGAIAHRWLDRLHADASVWNCYATEPGKCPLGSDVLDTRWIQSAAPLSTPPNVAEPWFLPAAAPGVSPIADALGAESGLSPTTWAPVFCTHIKLRQRTEDSVSARVRVSWRRDLSPIDCNDPALVAEVPDVTKYAAVYMFDIVRGQPL